MSVPGWRYNSKEDVAHVGFGSAGERIHEPKGGTFPNVDSLRCRIQM